MSTLLELPAAATAVAPTPGQASASPRILVVDADIYIRQLSAESLILCGYQVDMAEDGAAGWEALQARGYDLMIADHNLPGLAGLELIAKLRTAGMTLPVIMTTGTSPAQEPNRYPWLQLAATLLQPYTISELLGTVEKVLYATRRAGATGNPLRLRATAPLHLNFSVPPSVHLGANTPYRPRVSRPVLTP